MSDNIEQTRCARSCPMCLAFSAEQVAAMDDDTELFGALPELDSMAVAGLLTEMEDRLDIVIDDDEVDGELFATFGNLVAFAKAKVSGVSVAARPSFPMKRAGTREYCLSFGAADAKRTILILPPLFDEMNRHLQGDRRRRSACWCCLHLLTLLPDLPGCNETPGGFIRAIAGRVGCRAVKPIVPCQLVSHAYRLCLVGRLPD